jgi:phage anti-repressor protein
MNEIIKIENQKINNSIKECVNARDLWAKLESKQDFSTWIKDRLRDFEENTDYIKLHKKMELSKTGQIGIEYFITIEVAKNLCMIERNHIGKNIRKYFIHCEEKLNQQFLDPSRKHLDENIQKANSKKINSVNYHIGGTEAIKEYNRLNCLLHTGKTTQEIKQIGRDEGLKSKDTQSAKAVIRKLKPAVAGSMSLTDDLSSKNPERELEQIVYISKLSIPLFKAIIESGLKHNIKELH